ncbi:MAG: hypothetical protein LBB23_02700 [Rickettsiales bacterium]|nr:hypothetical protein [Rickettsiales bacterium]
MFLAHFLLFVKQNVWVGSNHPVRLRFATARHPATIGGEFYHYPVRLRRPPLR